MLTPSDFEQQYIEQLEGERDALRAKVAALENKLAGRGATLRSRLKWARQIRQERDQARADLGEALRLVAALEEAGDGLANASIPCGTKACMDARARWREVTGE